MAALQTRLTPLIRTAAALAAALIFSLAGAMAWADDQIAQIDPSRLLTEQQVDVYVSVTDQNGNPVDGLDAQNFTMEEGAPGGTLLPVRSFTLHEGTDSGAGITFFLLVDNSGSMYEPVSGGGAGGGETKIEAARAAIRTFVNSITNPLDKTGLATFSTYYRREVLPDVARSSVETALDKIRKPAAEGAYTELYASLRSAAKDLAGWKGRKVVILLTDGENYPYTVHTGKPSPQFGSEVVSSGQAVDALIHQGVSVFPIHFGPAKEDTNLEKIARSTGGRVFEASNETDLAGVYLDVRSRVLSEYRLTYTPRMIPGDRRLVRVTYDGPGGSDSAEQVYFVGTLFGGNSGTLSPLLLIPLLLALLGWFLLTRLRFLNRRSRPNLEVLASGRTQVFAMGDDRTVLRPEPDQSVTIVSQKKEDQTPPAPDEVTIVRNAGTGSFTVQSSEPVMVNNRPQRKRNLEPGDVLRIGEATIVFDDPKEE